jgi:hypothetical protein
MVLPIEQRDVDLGQETTPLAQTELMKSTRTDGT